LNKILKHILWVLAVLILTSQTPNQKDYCRIYGIIYFEKYKYAADAFVYIEEDYTQADMLIFKEDSKLFADKEGLWYITDNPALAHYRLYIEKDRRFSDFTIAFIEEQNFAGCQFK